VDGSLPLSARAERWRRPLGGSDASAAVLVVLDAPDEVGRIHETVDDLLVFGVA
jgi:hypothetical protein